MNALRRLFRPLFAGCLMVPLLATAQDSGWKTWVTTDGAMFEGQVKAAQPGVVTFVLKTGEERVTPTSQLSRRSQTQVAEALGLGGEPVAAATSPTPAATPSTAPTPAPTTTTAPPPAATPAPGMDLGTADGDAIDATEDAHLRSLVGAEAKVVGTVKSVPTLGSSGHRLIEFEGSDFNVFIHRDRIAESADWIIDDLPGKRLQVTGTVEMYREKPQMRGSTPSQLKRVR